jgi:hypothetical protein
LGEIVRLMVVARECSRQRTQPATIQQEVLEGER